MDDLISRQAAIDATELLIKDLRKDTVDVMNFGHNYNHGVADAIATLKHLPSAERTGRWIFNIDDEGWSLDYPYMCDQCGEWAEKVFKFCPNCGAKMKEGEE